MHAQLGQIMNKKTKKSNSHFGGVQRKKAGPHAWSLCMAQPMGWAGRLHHFSVPTYQSAPAVFVQSLSPVQLCATSWASARQTPLASTISQSLLQFTSLNQCCYLTTLSSASLHILTSLLLLPSIFSRIRLFSNELDLPIKWLQLHH